MKGLVRLKMMSVQADLSVSTRQPAMQIAPFVCRDDELLIRQAPSWRVRAWLDHFRGRRAVAQASDVHAPTKISHPFLFSPIRHSITLAMDSV